MAATPQRELPQSAQLTVTELPDVDDHDSVPDGSERIGTLLHDRYRIVRLLGEGGMGVVYEAEHLMIRRKVAIKFVHATFSRSRSIAKRFRNEAIAATAIGNPHIVDVTDMSRTPSGELYMVLEYLEGRELTQLLEDEGALTVARTVSIVGQLCQGLTAAHAAGIVHRDLKPENLFLTQLEGEEFVKILDFGIAKLRDGDGEGLTQTGQAMGTPYYMPPEQAEGSRSVDARADLWAVGVILYECLTGKRPFRGRMPGIMLRILRDPAPDVRDIRADVPEELAAIIKRLLEKDPDDRFPSAEALAQALQPFSDIDVAPEIDDLPPRVEPSTPTGVETMWPAGDGAEEPPAPETPSSTPAVIAPSRLPLLVALGAIVLALATVAFTTLGPSPEPPRTDREAAPQPVPVPVPPVLVQLSASPPAARLLLDGEEVRNPFSASLPPRDTPRRVEALLDGFQSASRELSGRYPQDVRMALSPEPESARPEAQPTAPAGRRAGGRRGVRRASVTPPPASPDPTPAAAPAPTPEPSPQPSPEPASPVAEDLNRVRF